MRNALKLVIILLVSILVAVSVARGQSDEICQELGETPTREVGRDNRLAPYVFGRVVVKGVARDARPPRVTAIYSDSSQPATRQQISRSGGYCFKRSGNSGILMIDVDGVEVARKTISDLSTTRLREDFEIMAPAGQQTAAPGVVSAKFTRPPNERTIDLYRKAAQAETEKQHEKAWTHVREIVAIDPDDFVAWAKLGSMYAEKGAVADAEDALKRALTIRRDYTPAMLNLGLLKALQNQIPDSIRLFERAVASDPTSARAYRLLGEAYLQNRQGTSGLAALDEALRIEPQGMAECHLLKARLYDLAGAKDLAAAEYKAFLSKITDHPEKKRFEKYVKENAAR